MSQHPQPGEPGNVDSERLARIEALLAPAVSGIEEAGRRLLPAWRRVTKGEPRWPSTLAVLVAVALQFQLPERLAIHPEWLLPTLETALLIALVAANPYRIERASKLYRWAGLVLIAMISAANGWSAVHLVMGLVRGTEGNDAGPLLATGGSIWLTNVIVFALWYWEWDRGGPVARIHAVRTYTDFLFPQMQTPELAPEHWEPQFPDYLYLSFTNATAFSPTDVMPLTRWAKMLMLLQSAVSLLTVVLVVARAVNIFK
ncbi:hypothetical protein GCM10010211_12050 [Streptomyces albospinus]|uniref:DUF1345 domain-containing protein n=1 Tax=Streptomyces albospinus TaxID=285515 RepID=A0ABQ2USQ7_9ACTN|nr:hypothetical protein [Streptomyces albospinus]GGU49469.1 hypothetical protein GCM10010211_12050 [Streptomyces albospinus]